MKYWIIPLVFVLLATQSYAFSCDEVVVDTDILLVDILNIENVAQQFTSDIILYFSWDTSCTGEEWRPDIQILNSRGEVEEYYNKVTLEEDRSVNIRRYYGTFSLDLNLQDFPLDTTKILFDIISVEEDVTFNVRSLDIEEDLGIQEWTIGEGKTEIFSAVSEIDGKTRKHIIISADATRKIGFYIWKLIVPLMLIVFMSWCVFWIDPKHLASQISVAAISMLNLIAYNFALSTFLPRISYLTRSDKFVLGCLILVFLCLVEAIITDLFISQKKPKLALLVDRISRILFPLMFILLIIFSFIL